MANYVLMYRGSSPRQADLDLIQRSPDVRIIDDTASRALLIETSEQAAERLRGQLQDWLVAEEKIHPAPGPAHQSVREERDHRPQ